MVSKDLLTRAIVASVCEEKWTPELFGCTHNRGIGKLKQIGCIGDLSPPCWSSSNNVLEIGQRLRSEEACVLELAAIVVPKKR